MRDVGMRDAKDATLRQRLARMSTWQSSTSTARLLAGVAYRSIALIVLIASAILASSGLTWALAIFAALLFVPSSVRIVRLLIQRRTSRP